MFHTQKAQLLQQDLVGKLTSKSMNDWKDINVRWFFTNARLLQLLNGEQSFILLFNHCYTLLCYLYNYSNVSFVNTCAVHSVKCSRQQCVG